MIPSYRQAFNANFTPEKYPGVHIAFGNPYGAHTGAEWYSSTHIDVVGRNFDIWVDGEQIMRGGKFLIES